MPRLPGRPASAYNRVMRGKAITIWFVLAALAIAASPARHAIAIDEITGTARVLHTDMIEVEGVTLRLFAIDVLAFEQTCDNGLIVYPCGQVAAGRLANALVNQTVVCAQPAGQQGVADGEAPQLAICRVRGVDIADWLVRTGFAFADRAHPEVYAEAETVARSSTTGIWRGPFVLPWDWRAGHREPALHAAP